MANVYLIHSDLNLEVPERPKAIAAQLKSSGLRQRMLHPEEPLISCEQIAREHAADYIVTEETDSPDLVACIYPSIRRYVRKAGRRPYEM